MMFKSKLILFWLFMCTTLQATWGKGIIPLGDFGAAASA
jgi:hypothetical protein